jgi:hypothetical protein
MVSPSYPSESPRLGDSHFLLVKNLEMRPFSRLPLKSQNL